MTQIKLIDTTLRDGQQSVWALGMSTAKMLAVIKDMDRAGFEEIEFITPFVQMKKIVRDLGEDPWQWLKLGTASVEKTPLRLHGHRGGLSHFPKSIVRLMIQKVIDHGIKTVRISSPWNNFTELRTDVQDLKKMGIEPIVNFVYSVSPRHTDEYFVDRAKDAAALNPYRICIKDVGGLLTPERIKELFPKIQAELGDITLELHLHSNNGLAPLNVIEAVRHGVTHIHTCIPPLASGSSQPSVFNVVNNLRALGYSVDIDDAALKPVERTLSYIARRENLPVGIPFEYDVNYYNHQMPGGMLSTFRYQLQKVGMEHQLDRAVEEVIQVRSDFGYPIMITPLSQFVASQAAINVIVGERYKEVTNEVIQYALGQWGKDAVDAMDKQVRAKILEHPKAKEFIDWKPSALTVEDVRKKYGKHLSDEDLILQVFVDEEAINIAKQAPKPQPYLSSQQPLVKLVQELARQGDLGFVSLQKGGCSLKLGKQG